MVRFLRNLRTARLGVRWCGHFLGLWSGLGPSCAMHKNLDTKKNTSKPPNKYLTKSRFSSDLLRLFGVYAGVFRDHM